MKAKLRCLTQPLYVVAAVAVGLIAFLPALEQTVFAGQVTTRYIQLSDSTPGATGVTYNVSFKPTVSTPVGGIVVDFCSDSPIIGNTTCAYPTGFALGTTPSVAVTSGIGTGGTWVTTNSLQGGGADAAHKQVLLYTNSTAQAVTAGTPIIFTISSVTNPSTTGSFYARILTFDTDAHATAQYTASGTARAASFTNQIDYGGIALSTADAISITAKVQETLTFCVSKAAPGNGCSGTSTPTLTLGHGSPLTLDSTQADTDTAYTQVSSNASSGVSVNLKVTSSTTCAGLSRDGGATCGIPATGSTPIAIPASTADFGLEVENGSGGTGTVTASAGYHDGTATHYAMSNATFGTYGDTIESSTGPTANVNSLLTYAAQAAITTQAGIYSTTHSLIATGTF